jgi:peptidyl-tRNA hydrolase
MTHGKVHRRVLNDEQLEWLRRWFPTTENKRLSKAMKISLFKLHEFARENGLTKSEAGM